MRNDAQLRLEIEVPSGTQARVVLPGRATGAGPVSVDEKVVTAKLENESLVIENLPPGRHVILRPAVVR